MAGCNANLGWRPLLGFLGLLLVLAAALRPAPAFGQAEPAAQASAAGQAGMAERRQAFIGKLVDAGVFQKLERSAGIARLWVRSPFYGLEFERKQQLARMVFAHFRALDPACDYVAIYDSNSGRRVGRYSAAGGGLTMD